MFSEIHAFNLSAEQPRKAGPLWCVPFCRIGTSWGAVRHRVRCLSVPACHLQTLAVTNPLFSIELSPYFRGWDSRLQLAPRQVAYGHQDPWRNPKAILKDENITVRNVFTAYLLLYWLFMNCCYEKGWNSCHITAQCDSRLLFANWWFNLILISLVCVCTVCEIITHLDVRPLFGWNPSLLC